MLDLTGISIVVTGATSGIGLAAVKAFTKAGAFVIGVGRAQERNRNAISEVLNSSPDAKVEYLLADLANQSQVRDLSKEISTRLNSNGHACLDALVNNAGAYNERKHMTEDGIEQTFAVNHLAAFLLTHELLPLLQKSKIHRVLTVSSYSHFTTPLSLKRIADPRPYIGLLAYKRSKLCNVLFIYELNRRCKKINGFAVDPGLVNTSIASKGGRGVSHMVWRIRRNQGTSVKIPAETLLFLVGENAIDTSHGFYFKNCAPKNPSKNAQRRDLAANLWTYSSELTGVHWPPC